MMPKNSERISKISEIYPYSVKEFSEIDNDSGPEGIWTPGLWIKSPSLCLTKLRAHALLLSLNERFSQWSFKYL